MMTYTQHNSIYLYDDTYGILSVKDSTIIPISFCPWTGEIIYAIGGEYPFHDCIEVDDSLTDDQVAYAENTKQFVLDHSCLFSDSNEDDGATHSKYTKDELLAKVHARWDDWRLQHTKYGMCVAMHEQIIYRKHYTYLSQIPTIRAYVLFREGKRAGFDFLDYCPFCGAKLPQRLDDVLTKVLKGEYKLESWRDYKKAPKEFHTDKWWKDRGLSCYDENNDINVELDYLYEYSNGMKTRKYVKPGIVLM